MIKSGQSSSNIVIAFYEKWIRGMNTLKNVTVVISYQL